MTDKGYTYHRMRASESEEDHFRKKDRELIERMRQAAESERARTEMSAKTGLNDPELLRDLEELGFTPETIGVLPLVPIVQMAWAEGGITSAERQLLVGFARERNIAEGTAADGLLTEWMTRQPSEDVFDRATRLIRAILDSGVPEPGGMSADDVISYSESIAAASGGILGIGKISAEERATLARIVAALKTRS